MENIFIPDNNFKFTNNITLGTPYSIYKGTYFTKLFHNNSPLFIQIPKCVTKQGFIKNKKKTICDLLFTNNDDILYPKVLTNFWWYILALYFIMNMMHPSYE